MKEILFEKQIGKLGVRFTRDKYADCYLEYTRNGYQWHVEEIPYPLLMMIMEGGNEVLMPKIESII